ncbi:hypothetical protein SEPCBS119000_004439 [Sporothrix epigloea]|uniref:Uncharacterized protein n=1 Tax=Sporothrix epigloea TaxID=1892477 RepID=A0ABP0DS50_9PEZI
MFEATGDAHGQKQPMQALHSGQSRLPTLGRIREMVYPLTLALTSFAVSFAVGIMAAHVAAAGLATRLMARAEELLYEMFKSYGLLATVATIANAVATVADKQLELLAEKYRPATFDSVVKTLLVGGREGVPAYQQYPFLGMILVPAMTAILLAFMFAWRIIRSLEAFKTLTMAAARVRGH